LPKRLVYDNVWVLGETIVKLLIATQNLGKVREFRRLLSPLGAELCFPSELGLELEVLEDGATYVDNARKKAEAFARASGLLTLADDSGLEVDALDGAPGVRSARYTEGHDGDRVTALLTQLLEVPWEQRTARFRCVVVIITPEGESYTTEGVCEGQIALEPVGEGGFGYDPVFYLARYGCTMAQLPQDEKNRISHRGRAAEAALPILGRLMVK
jgi:XTP/dITP diphosphohydrolase